MNETKLNAVLVKSLRKAFNDIGINVEVGKRHGSMFSASYPDVEGCVFGRSFYVEGKIAKIGKSKSSLVVSNKQYSPGQLVKIEELHNAGAAVFLSLYVLSPNKYCILVPYAHEGFREMLGANLITKEYAETELAQYYCHYEKQLYTNLIPIMAKGFRYMNKIADKIVNIL